MFCSFKSFCEQALEEKGLLEDEGLHKESSMTQAKNASTVLTRSVNQAFFSKPITGTSFLIVILLLLSACGTTTGSSASTTPTSPTSTQQQPGASGTGAATTTAPSDKMDTGAATTTAPSGSAATSTSGYAIKVYFSKFPDSGNNFNAVFPVNRSSPTSAVATFSLQLLIAGPTLGERDAGYFSEFNSILSGPSSCSAPHPTGGPDFTLTLNMKGSKAAAGTATVRLCRASSSPGVGADARILAEINATLKQFSTIKNVVVLTQAGSCFGDESGQNICLK